MHGWYRRGPTPYFEMKNATLDNGETVNCHYYQFQLAFSVVITILGAALAFLVPYVLAQL